MWVHLTHMEKPSEQVIEAIAPAKDIAGLTVIDSGIRNVVGAEMKNSLRLSRHGPYEATLVSVQKYYDGLSGGEAGDYALLYIEFRAASSRWRTSGVKVRAAEALRLARDMLAGKASKPGRNENQRIGGKTVARNDSSLCGAPVGDGYMIYVKCKDTRDHWVRTRGVHVLALEAPIVANELKSLADKVMSTKRTK
jgi:hypothetical protein